MRYLRGLMGLIAAAAVIGGAAHGQTQRAGREPVEDYVHEPMPPGFQVVIAELEGPVFADAHGKTLYTWPLNAVRNGDLGERKNQPTCDDTHYRVNSGLQSPYPGGLELPDVDHRPSCIQYWPPVYASADSKPVGSFTVVDRKDGRKQWAYEGYALYTSILDEQPGDVRGGTKWWRTGGDGRETGVLRIPASPPPAIPPQFAVNQISSGRLLTTAANDRSIYVWDKDTATKSNCDELCLREWAPVLAPEGIRPQGEWAIIENSPGVKQWTFRKKPVYTHILDSIPHSRQGSDVPGWHNVFTQKAPPAPKGWTVHGNREGDVLADAQGRTIYVYRCNDDAVDQLACDHPTQPQVYRLAVCGKNDPALCNKMFPYVIAASDAKSDTRIWTTMDINPTTGKKAVAGEAGALHVWAYRDRPVYYCSRDKKPGDIECDSWGELFGLRNGFKAFWVRDDFGGYHG
ncbi:MAG: hypothetical protein ACYCZX_06660 [Rhodospirillaceae bacterium]